MPPHPTPKKCARYFTCRIGMATLWSACAAVCRVNKWFADDVLCSVMLLKVNFVQTLTYHAKLTTSVGWNDALSSPKPFFRPPLFQHSLMATLWSACSAVCRVNKWFADDVLCSVMLLKVNIFQTLTYHAKLTTFVGWNDVQSSPRPFCDPRFFERTPHLNNVQKVMKIWWTWS